MILKSSKFVSFGIQREAVWSKAEWPDLGPKWVRLTPNRTNLGHFQIRFILHFNSPSQNVLKSDVKKCPRFVYIKIIEAEAATVLNRIKGK